MAIPAPAFMQRDLSVIPFINRTPAPDPYSLLTYGDAPVVERVGGAGGQRPDWMKDWVAPERYQGPLGPPTGAFPGANDAPQPQVPEAPFQPFLMQYTPEPEPEMQTGDQGRYLYLGGDFGAGSGGDSGGSGFVPLLKNDPLMSKGEFDSLADKYGLKADRSWYQEFLDKWDAQSSGGRVMDTVSAAVQFLASKIIPEKSVVMGAKAGGMVGGLPGAVVGAVGSAFLGDKASDWARGHIVDAFGGIGPRSEARLMEGTYGPQQPPQGLTPQQQAIRDMAVAPNTSQMDSYDHLASVKEMAAQTRPTYPMITDSLGFNWILDEKGEKEIGWQVTPAGKAAAQELQFSRPGELSGWQQGPFVRPFDPIQFSGAKQENWTHYRDGLTGEYLPFPQAPVSAQQLRDMDLLKFQYSGSGYGDGETAPKDMSLDKPVADFSEMTKGLEDIGDGSIEQWKAELQNRLKDAGVEVDKDMLTEIAEAMKKEQANRLAEAIDELLMAPDWRQLNPYKGLFAQNQRLPTWNDVNQD